jgi:hypothetical protein
MNFKTPALAALVAALVPAAADAAPKSPRYELTVRGTQVTTWEYDKVQQPQCDWPEHERGDQTITFRSQKPSIERVQRRKGVLVLRGDGIVLEATGEANRDVETLYTQMSPCGGDGGPFGGDGGPVEDYRDSLHCKVSGLIGWSVAVFKVDPDHLTAVGDAEWPAEGSFPTFPAACAQSGQGDASIGITDSRGEWAGNLIRTRIDLPKKLLSKKGPKVMKLSGSETVSYPNDKQPEQPRERTTGKTVLAWNMTFKRVGR